MTTPPADAPQGIWCITGATGALGSCLVRRLLSLGKHPVLGVARGARPDAPGRLLSVDLADAKRVRQTLRWQAVELWIHTAAVTSIAAARREPQRADAVNVEATRALVELAAERNARFVFCSTDLVFDGRSPPYDESAEPRPISHYARTKLQAERIVAAYHRGVVVRLALMYGFPALPRRTTFVEQVSAMRAGRRLRLFADELRTPLWLEDAAAAMEAIAESDVTGVLHVGGPQRLSRLEMGRLVAAGFGLTASHIEAICQRDVPSEEPRPPDVSLDCGRFRSLFPQVRIRPMHQALSEMAATSPPIPEWI